MFRALVWKEWRQLGLVRWGGMAIGAALPLVLVAAAELSRRGLLPIGRTTGYETRDVMFEILPAFMALGLWPLIALMAASQAFGGERVAGTETFLLERPVQRTRFWWARVAASIGAILFVIGGSAAIGLSSAYLSGQPSAIGWSRWLILAAIGLGVSVLAWIGGTIAAVLIPSPLGAVLAGAVMGAVPVVLAIQLTTVFPHSRIDTVPIGIVLCALLLPAFVIASWFVTSRGEPGGKGRIKRGLAVAGGGLIAVPLVFAATSPLAMRIEAGRGMHYLESNSSGTAAIVVRESPSPGGWLVSVPAGEKMRFIPPPLRDLAWSPDGATLAIATWAGALGGERSSQRIDLVDPRTGAMSRSLALPDQRSVSGFILAGDALVAILYDENAKEPTAEVYVARIGSGVWKSTGFRRTRVHLQLIGPLKDGRVLLHEIDWKKKDPAETEVTHLYPVDVESGTVEAEIRSDPLTDAFWLDRRHAGISPSGRYQIVQQAEGRGYQVLDLQDGSILPDRRSMHRPRWLSGDRLAWIAWWRDGRTLVLADLGGPARLIRRWPIADVRLDVSPDGEGLLVAVLPFDPSQRVDLDLEQPWVSPSAPIPSGKVPEELVYTRRDDRVIDLGPPFAERINEQRRTEWAGPNTLARIAPGVVAFEDIDAPGKRRYVIGGAGDAR